MHPFVAASLILSGQVRAHAAADTVTVKVHDPVLFEASVAVHVTVVLPNGKLVPVGGLQVTCTSRVQLSVAVGVT